MIYDFSKQHVRAQGDFNLSTHINHNFGNILNNQNLNIFKESKYFSNDHHYDHQN
jgi:hypothetical protein